MHGSANILKKALSLVGAGAKVIDWYNFGPIVDSYSAIGMHEANHSMFKYITTANRMIADADDLLFAGTMPDSDVAVLWPRSSWLWDNASYASATKKPPNAIIPPLCAATIVNLCGGYGSLCAECLANNSQILTSAGCPNPENSSNYAIVKGFCNGLIPTGPSGNEAQGSSASDYMATVFALFRSLQQVANIQVRLRLCT